MGEQDDLARLAELTAKIRGNLAANDVLATERRQVVLRLRESGVTYKQMAERAGLSEVYLWKIMKGPAEVKQREKATAKRRKASQ